MMEGIEDVVKGRRTGLTDIQGRELFDGDEVFSLNIYAEDGKSGMCCTVRLLKSGAQTIWTAGGTGISYTCSDPRFGLYRLRGAQ